MAAGIATLKKYDDSFINKINRLGDKLREGFNDGFQKAGVKGQATGYGSLCQIHFGNKEISTSKDVKNILAAAKKLPILLVLELINRGIFPIYRAGFCTSTPMAENEINKTLKEFEKTLEVLKPYIEEQTPNLLREA